MLTNVRQENPTKGIFPIAVAQRMRPDNLISFLAVLLQEHDVAPGRRTEMTGVVVGISRPGESVVGHMIPLFACDFASFAPDANTRIGEESNLDMILHVRVFSLVRALDSFTDHNHTQFSGLGSARVSRVGFGVSPKQAFFACPARRKVRDGETPSPTRETRALPEEIRRS